MNASLTKENILLAYKKFNLNDHFQQIIFPRLKVIYFIKKELKDFPELQWSFQYDHINIHNNHIKLSYIPCKGSDYEFSYEIPLMQNFELRLFLGKSSVHFIELYNHMINDNLIEKNQFPIRAEYRTLPHFLLNGEVKRYQMSILQQIIKQDDFQSIIDTLILDVIREAILQFNPILKKILLT